MNIYIWRDDEQYGPYTEAQARIYLDGGHLDPDDQARVDGGRWVYLSELLPSETPIPAPENHAAAAEAAPVASESAVVVDSATAAAIATAARDLPADFYPAQQELVLGDPRPAPVAKPPPAKRPSKKAVWVPAPIINPEPADQPAPVSIAVAEAAPAFVPEAAPDHYIPDNPPPLDDVPEIVPDSPRPENHFTSESPPTGFAPEPDSPRPQRRRAPDYPPTDPNPEPAVEFVPVDNPREFPPVPPREPEPSSIGLIVAFLVVVAILDSAIAYFYFSHKPAPIVASAEPADTYSDSAVPLPPTRAEATPAAPAKPASSGDQGIATAASPPAPALTFTSATNAPGETTLALAAPSTPVASLGDNAVSASATPPAADSTPPAPKITAPNLSTPAPLAPTAPPHGFLTPTNSLAPPPDLPSPTPAIPVDQLGTAPKTAGSSVATKSSAPPAAPKPAPAIVAAPHPKGPGHNFDADAIMKACMAPEGFGSSFDTGIFNKQFVNHTFTFTGEVARLNEHEGLVVFHGGGSYPKNWDLQLSHGKFTFEPGKHYRVVFRLIDVKNPPFSGYSFRGKVLGKSKA